MIYGSPVRQVRMRARSTDGDAESTITLVSPRGAIGAWAASSRASSRSLRMENAVPRRQSTARQKCRGNPTERLSSGSRRRRVLGEQPFRLHDRIVLRAN